MYQKMIGVISEVLHVPEEELTKETSFADDLGADSLEVYQLVIALEEAFDTTMEQSIEDVTVATVGELYEKLKLIMQP